MLANNLIRASSTNLVSFKAVALIPIPAIRLVMMEYPFCPPRRWWLWRVSFWSFLSRIFQAHRIIIISWKPLWTFLNVGSSPMISRNYNFISGIINRSQGLRRHILIKFSRPQGYGVPAIELNQAICKRFSKRLPPNVTIRVENSVVSLNTIAL